MHTLVKGLEKIAASADIPMLVAGDFNSIPGSAAHSLLVKHSVDADHPVRSLPKFQTKIAVALEGCHSQLYKWFCNQHPWVHAS